MLRLVPSLESLDGSPVEPTPLQEPEPQQPDPASARSPARDDAGHAQAALAGAKQEAEHAAELTKQQNLRLSQKVGTLEAANFQLQQRVEDLQMQADEADERATDAMVQKVELDTEMTELRRQAGAHSAEKNEIEDALHQTTTQLQQLAAENHALQEKIDSAARAEQAPAAKGRAEEAEESVQLRRSLVAARQTNNTLTDEVEQMRAELAAARQIAEQGEQPNSRLLELEQTNASLVQEVEQLKQTADEQSEAMMADNDSLQSLLEEANSKCELEQTRAATLDQHATVLQEKLGLAAAEVKRQHSELSMAHQSLLRAERAMGDSKQRASATSELQKENALLLRQLSEAEIRASQVGDVLLVHEQSLADAQHALEKSKQCIRLNEDLQEENSALVAKLEEISGAHAASDAELGRSRMAIDEMRERLLHSEKNEQRHLAELAHARASLEQMQQAGAQDADTRATLKAEVESLRRAAQESDVRAASAAEEAMAARRSAEGAERLLAESKAGVARMAELQSENEQLRAQLSQAQQGHESARQQLKDTESRAAAVTESLNTARSSLEGAEQSLEQSKRLIAEKAALKRENEGMRERWAAEREENERIRLTLETGHQQGSALLAEAEKRAVEGAAERRALAESLARERETAATLKAENASLKAQIKSAADSATVSAVVESSQKSLREAEQNLRTAVERSFEVSEVREENSRLQAGLAQATEENRSLRSQLTEADAKAAAVDAVLDTTATSLRTAETALAKSRDSAAQIAAMQQENADLRRELDAALSKCETCERSERQHEMEGRSAKEEIATLRREAQDLSDQLRKSTAAEHEVNALRQRLGEAEQAGHDVSAVLDVTRDSLEHAERAMQTSKHRSDTMQSELDELGASLRQAEADRDRCTEDLKEAITAKDQAEHASKVAAANSARDRAELQQLQLHLSRTSDRQYSPRGEDGESALPTASGEGPTAEEMSLLGVRLASMEQVLLLQEEELANQGETIGDSAKQVATEQLLRSWREKVLSLLVQQKSTDLLHRQELAAAERRHQELSDEISHLRSKTEVLKQAEVNVKAEAEIARNKQDHAEQVARDATAVKDAMGVSVAKEREQLCQLASALRSKHHELVESEEQIRKSSMQLQGYSDRMEFAVGRIRMVHGVMAAAQLRARRLDGSEVVALPYGVARGTQTTAEDFGVQLDDSLAGGSAPENGIIFHQNLEIKRLTKERDFLLQKSLERERQESERAATSRESAQHEVQEVEKELADARSCVADLTAALEEAQGSADAAREEAGKAQREAGERAEELRASAAAELEDCKAACAHELSAAQRELQKVRREHSKSLVALRTLERQIARGEEASAEEGNERERQLTEALRRREEQVAHLKAERATLVASVRDARLEAEDATLGREAVRQATVDQAAQTAAVMHSEREYDDVLADRPTRLQEQQWWERRQRELEKEIALLRQQQLIAPHHAAEEARGEKNAGARAMAAEAAAIELEREAAMLALQSDSDTDSFSSSDGSSGDSAFVRAGTMEIDESDSDSDTSISSDEGIHFTAPALNQAGLSREERVGRLAELSAEILRDEGAVG